MNFFFLDYYKVMILVKKKSKFFRREREGFKNINNLVMIYYIINSFSYLFKIYLIVFYICIYYLRYIFKYVKDC